MINWTYFTIPLTTGSVIEAHALHCHLADLSTTALAARDYADVETQMAALATEHADLAERLSGTRPTITVQQSRCMQGMGRQCPDAAENDAVRAAAIRAAVAALGGDETRDGHIGDLGPYATYRGLAAAVVDAIADRFTLTARAGSTT
ncbi:hypothetical protein [Glycomyces sp. YM15]|uniref:hypothetical protein n=1 Tax=Glycomyces sp. YM15 TaxID=2800446 RepID=UPI00196275B0|nr:hypothetical protein [Glycomyces sp. YM15]